MITLLNNKSWYDKTIRGKVAALTSGPNEIVCINVNGTVTLQLWVGVTEQINIHNTIPYKDPLV